MGNSVSYVFFPRDRSRRKQSRQDSSQWGLSKILDTTVVLKMFLGLAISGILIHWIGSSTLDRGKYTNFCVEI